MGRRLYQACLSGSVSALDALIEIDQLILDRVSSLTCFSDDTPLHVAALRSHLDFTKALLARKPKLATELDSLRCSPLHLASAEGHVEIVRELLRVNTDVCIARDEDGRIPLHLAVMKGRVETIEYLLGIKSVKDHVQVKNKNGFTALDIVEFCPNRDLKTMEVLEFFLKVGVRRSVCSESDPNPESPPNNPPPQRCCKAGVLLFGCISRFWTKYIKVDRVWLQESHVDFSEDQVNAFLCDVVTDDLCDTMMPSSIDVVTLPDGHILLRDYAQVELDKRNQMISENFYIRGDGTNIEYLSGIKSVKEHANVKNKNGSTALDVVEHYPNRDLKTMEIREFLLQVGVRRSVCSKPDPHPESPPNNPPPQRCCKDGGLLIGCISRFWTNYIKVHRVWLQEWSYNVFLWLALPVFLLYKKVCKRKLKYFDMDEREDMGRRLKKACLSGSVTPLEALIEEDELILNRVSSLPGFFHETPLHIAAFRGHLDFTKVLLTQKPKLATELDLLRCSPLHLASTEGHFEIVRELLQENTDVHLS
ncbi:hypothetical protein RHSIM_Rhsim12G0208400 [Rhododendron simsii]|uniref:Ankyrin repeat family protein n=1 Tax=Rhododendron simsii TaxID=118357 RepID=A0A834G1C8_RHOSS|nr:hypothetical protein RHSIM_Rhsim12G0208400 [Rhododendron simsii]